MIGAIIAKKKAHSGFATLNQRDLSAFLASWAENATFVYPGNLSVSGKIEGKKAIEEWFRKLMEQFPKVNFTVRDVFVQNIFALGGTNVVAIEWDIDLTNREGRDFQNSGVTIISIKNGKITLVRDYLFDAEVQKRTWGEEKG